MARPFLAAELDDRNLNLLVGTGAGDTARVAHAEQIHLHDEQAATVAAALAERCELRQRRHAEVTLLLRSRHVVAGHVADSRLQRQANVAQVLLPAARKLGLFGDQDQLTIGYRLRGGTPAEADLCVAPKALVDDLERALREHGFQRIKISCVESVLAAGIHVPVDGPICILELRHDRALLVMTKAGRVLVTRRFRMPVPLAEQHDNSHEIAPLVVGELTRSLGFFRDQGKGEPRMLLLTGPLDESSTLAQRLQSIAGLPTSLIPPPTLLGLPDDERQARAWLVPALGTLVPSATYPHLLEPPRLETRQVLTVAGLQALGTAALLVSGLALAWKQSPEARQLADEVEQARRRRDELIAETEQRRADLQPLSEVAERRKLLAELTHGTTPRSLLCNLLARERDDTLQFTKLELDTSGELKVLGLARTDDRLTALRALGHLETGLRRLPAVARTRTALTAAKTEGQIAFELSAHLMEKRR